jgi:integrase
MELIKRKSGSRYKVKIYLPSGNTATKTFRRKADAQAWKRERLSDRDKFKATGISYSPKTTFGNIYQQWYDRKVVPVLQSKSIGDYRNTAHKHLLPRFGFRSIGTIGRVDADILVSDLRLVGRQPKTINRIVAQLKQILKFAVEEQVIPHSCLAGYPQLRLPPQREIYLTEKEVFQLLLVAQGSRIFTLIQIAVNTGMRLGEICGLCWDRVNFENGFIEVTRTRSREGLQETTKTHRKRYVPINSELKLFLQALRWQQCHPIYVCCDENGQPFNPDHLNQREFKRLLEKAKVSTVRFHDLRHTYASLFMMKGGSIFDLQKILGHTRIEQTTKYAHLSPDHLKRAAETVVFGVQNLDSPHLALVEKLEG